MQGSYISRRSFIGIAGMSALAVAGFGLAGCSGSNGASAESGNAASGKKALSGTITAVGSTALQPLCEAAAEQFMQENPGVQITVQGEEFPQRSAVLHRADGLAGLGTADNDRIDIVLMPQHGVVKRQQVPRGVYRRNKYHRSRCVEFVGRIYHFQTVSVCNPSGRFRRNSV